MTENPEVVEEEGSVFVQLDEVFGGKGEYYSIRVVTIPAVSLGDLAEVAVVWVIDGNNPNDERTEHLSREISTAPELADIACAEVHERTERGCGESSFVVVRVTVQNRVRF